MEVLDLVTLTPLMQPTRGRTEIAIGLIDGPVVREHPDLDGDNIRELPAANAGRCARPSGVACRHGTFVAGILQAKRGSAAPAIRPGCRMLVRPIFTEANSGNGHLPGATPKELAPAICETIAAGAP